MYPNTLNEIAYHDHHASTHIGLRALVKSFSSNSYFLCQEYWALFKTLP
jgi:hypothetical protein